MANIEYGVLKLAVAKASGMVVPIGLVAVAAIWVWKARDRHSAAAPRDDSSTARPMGRTDAGSTPHRAAGEAHAGERTSYRYASAAPLRGGTDREALLSQILEENIRLREALK